MSQEHLADPVLLEQHQGLARITLNRPAKYNALSEEVLDSLQHILDKLAQDPSLQCVIIQAEGKAFCAGHDLKQMRSKPEHDYYRDLFSRCSRVMQAVLALQHLALPLLGVRVIALYVVLQVALALQ